MKIFIVHNFLRPASPRALRQAFFSTLSFKYHTRRAAGQKLIPNERALFHEFLQNAFSNREARIFH
jgi:hypothetical protein